MLQFILKRILSGLVTVFVIATLTFLAMHLVPGDPISGQKAMSPEIRANLERKYGLDKPISTQYVVYMKNMLKGDFGISFTQQNRSVNDIIRSHFPVSAWLGIAAIILSVFAGVMFGSISALFRGRLPDGVVMFLAIVGISVPNFVFAALGQYMVTEVNKRFGWEVLPVGGWGTFKHVILPAIVLELSTLAFLARLMRSSMLEVIHQDYVRTAKAKGLSPARIFFSHQLRNAILPVITFLGPAIAYITTGGFVVESVFAIPGLGRYFVQAVQQLDYTVIMGLTVFYGAFLVFMVIAVDIVYGMIDPRISVAKRRA
jgi:ABC-type dipeptide/oligopeptide/nickel transport system permease component